MPTHTGRLVLTTLDPLGAPEPDLVAECLAEIGFLGLSPEEALTPQGEGTDGAAAALSYSLPGGGSVPGHALPPAGSPELGPESGPEAEQAPQTRPHAQPQAGRCYPPGPAFLGLLAFTGCAVTLPATDAACRIRITDPIPAPRLLAGRNTRAPRCPGCRARLTDWRERAAGWEAGPPAGVQCPACREVRPAWRWDWKQQGGFGRLFVLVDEVFPGEAVPGPRLLDRLTRASSLGWRWFYLQD